MKKIFFATCLAIGLAVSCQAQLVPSFLGGGGRWCYTNLDSVHNALTDTFRAAVPFAVSCLGIQTDLLKVSGTPAGWVQTFVSADGGASYALQFTDTIKATSLTAPQVIYHRSPLASGESNNPYTHIMQVLTGVGTQVCSWKSYIVANGLPLFGNR